jgi:TP901 family phage tail tape measure protein
MASNEEILSLALRITGEQESAALKKSLEGLGLAAGTSAGEIDKMVSELDTMVAASKKLEQFATGTAKLADLESQLAAAREGLKGLNAEFDGTGKRTGEVGKAFKAAEKAVADLEKEQAKQVATLDRLGGELKEAGVDTTKLGAESERLKKTTADTATSLQEKSAALKEAKEQAEQSAQRWKELGDQLETVRERSAQAAARIAAVGAAAAAAVVSLAAYGTVRFFKAGIEDAAEFESALGRIQAAAGETDDAMGAVKESIEAAAAAASRDVTEAAQAFEMLTREGFKTQDAMDQLKPALDFATASGLGLKESIGALTGVLDQFQIGAENAGDAADVIAASAKAGGTSVADMAQALEQAGPTAHQLGLELNDTAAALAVLAKNGIEGGKAGAALRTILVDLSDPTSRLQRELRDLGIESTDLGTVLDELSRRGDGAERAFNALGAKGGTALRALVSESAGLRQMTVDLKETTGAVATMAEIINRDLATSAANAERAFADLRRQFVEPLLEPLRKELDVLTEKLRAVAASPEFASIRESMVKIFEAGIEAAKKFVNAVDWQAFAKQLETFAKDAATHFTEYADKIGNAAKATGDFVDKVEALGRKFEALNNMRETAISAVGAIASAFPIAANKAAEFAAELAGFDDAARDFGENADTIMGWVTGISTTIDDAAGKGAQLGENIKLGLEVAEGPIATIVAGLRDLAQAAAEGMPDLAKLGAETKTALDRFRDGATDARAALKAIGDGSAEVTDEIRAQWQELRDDLVAAATDLARQIQAELKGMNREDVLEKLRHELTVATNLAGRFDEALAKSAKKVEDTGAKAEEAGRHVRGFADAQRDVADATERAADAVDAYTEAQERANETIIVGQELTQASIRALDLYAGNVNKLASAQMNQSAEFERRLQLLDAELALYDPLSRKVTELRGQYDLLDDAQLQQMAQRELRLEREREKLEREAERVERERKKLEQVNQSADSNRVDFRVEMIVRNEQRSGDQLIAEITEQALHKLVQRIMAEIRSYMP